MRYRISALGLVMGLIVLPVGARGQGAAAPGTKIGVINMQEALASTAEGKKAFADLQKKYDPRREELQRQQQEINALQEQLQRQAATLSDEERVRLGRELEDKQKLFKRAQEDANADFQSDQQDAIRRIGQKMVRIIAEYAPQNGYALIVDGAQIPVYYVADGVDLTDEMIKRFDAANPVEGAASPSASPAAAAPAKPAAPKPAEKPKP
jgi:outer membrane protein